MTERIPPQTVESGWRDFWLGVTSLFDITGTFMGRELDRTLEEMEEEWRQRDEAQQREWERHD